MLLISKSITETLKAEKKYLQHQSLQQAYSPLVPKYRRGDTKLKSSGGIIATMQSLLSSSDQSRDSHFVKSSQKGASQQLSKHQIALREQSF